MGTFASLVDNLEGIENFKARYNIPPKVWRVACSKIKGGCGDSYYRLYKGRNENPYRKGD